MERLQKVLASAGVASRRACEKLITAGHVKVNGQIVTELGTKVSTKDVLEVDGNKIKKEKLVYYLFYKPRDVIVTMSDPRGRKTIADYFNNIDQQIHPIGRLDRETSGLILLTNDGDLTNKLIHPKYKIYKKYYVKASGTLTASKLKILGNGVELSDGKTAPAKVELISVADDVTELYLTIHEGKNRQVRRMIEAVGSDVVVLMRVKFAFLKLQGLKPGQRRRLLPAEVSRLKKIVKKG